LQNAQPCGAKFQEMIFISPIKGVATPAPSAAL
jgi:hypothetical protein